MRACKLSDSSVHKAQNRTVSQDGEERGCKTCFFRLHYPWVCKPPSDKGRNCPDWKGRDA